MRVLPKTPRCPACDSGMDVPGVRHNAECKRKRELHLRRVKLPVHLLQFV